MKDKKRHIQDKNKNHIDLLSRDFFPDFCPRVSSMLSFQAYEREQEKNRCERGTKHKIFVLENKNKIIKSLLCVFRTLCLEWNVINWKSTRSHESNVKRTIQVSLQPEHISSGDPQSQRLSKDGTKTGKMLRGIIGKLESDLE